MVNATHQTLILRSPPVMFIHFKRSSLQGRKTLHRVDYPSVLHLSHLMVHGSLDGPYHLSGVISHVGEEITSGHYIARVKAADSRWYKMDDENIKALGEAPLDRQDAYVLLYQCQADNGMSRQVSRTLSHGETSFAAQSTVPIMPLMEKTSPLNSVRSIQGFNQHSRTDNVLRYGIQEPGNDVPGFISLPVRVSIPPSRPVRSKVSLPFRIDTIMSNVYT